MLKRDIYRTLLEWKNEERRQPLLLRGARQIGKTYLIEQLGKNEFENFVVLNFEKNPEYEKFFTSLDPKEMIEKIVFTTREKIKTGKTLLFIDEIQNCPRAIVALRYFYEEMPELHVIAAGSLLEFALSRAKINIPVGRIQYLFMYPLSFKEFLLALGYDSLHDYLYSGHKIEKIDEVIHDKLIELVRKYYLLGGMPKVVDEYVKSGDVNKCEKIQRSILDTYSDDFKKYAPEEDIMHLKTVFHSIPSMVGRKYVYSKVDPETRSADLKRAVQLLEMAGVVTRVKRTSASAMPLEAGVKHSYFKLLFLDIGLLHSISGLYPKTMMVSDLNTVYMGGVSEQFVGQELLAYEDPFHRDSLYYWLRESRNSSAEIDYLIQRGGNVYPIEVKSGSTGRLKSMALFMDQFKSKKGYKVSQAPYSEGKITEIPFYMIEKLFSEPSD
ncbi:MAG: AAA family ATPase [Candidatus Delongbacteria bacterium]